MTSQKMSLLSRRGTRIRALEADPLLARDRSPTAYGFALRRALGSGQESTTTSNTLLSSETLFPSPSPSTGSSRQGISQVGDRSQLFRRRVQIDFPDGAGVDICCDCTGFAHHPYSLAVRLSCFNSSSCPLDSAI